MENHLLEQILTDQRNLVDRKERGIRRKVDAELHLKSSLISVISGVRRCGKSTLTLQLADQYPDFHFITFDDERLINFGLDDFNAMIVLMRAQRNADVLVLDEIQLVDGWERFVRRMNDEGVKVILTGSNASLLSSELATRLTGRYIKTELFPFSFHEYLILKNIDLEDKSSLNLGRIWKFFDEYLVNGGFPEYLKSGNREFLKRVYDDVLYRDLIVRFGIRNSAGFKNLAQYIFTNFTSEFNHLTLSKVLGINSPTSIKEYINCLAEGYMIFEVARFDYSLKKQYTQNKKIYVIDTGIRNTIAFRTTADSGRMLENLVFLELKRRSHEIWYYKTKRDQETDFLINPANPHLIQVCYSLQDPVTRNREIISLKACMMELGLKEGLIVTMSEEFNLTENGLEIKIVPAWKWTLGL
jgi:predicted AAA+ superfamily ATPase